MSRSNMPQLVQPEWMDLKTAVKYACVSERLLREWIHRPVDPLPAVQVDHGKLLVKRPQFDRWLEAHPYVPIERVDVDQIVNDVLIDFKEAA
jgi:hypothetical protein